MEYIWSQRIKRMLIKKLIIREKKILYHIRTYRTIYVFSITDILKWTYWKSWGKIPYIWYEVTDILIIFSLPFRGRFYVISWQTKIIRKNIICKIILKTKYKRKSFTESPERKKNYCNFVIAFCWVKLLKPVKTR